MYFVDLKINTSKKEKNRYNLIKSQQTKDTRTLRIYGVYSIGIYFYSTRND